MGQGEPRLRPVPTRRRQGRGATGGRAPRRRRRRWTFPPPCPASRPPPSSSPPRPARYPSRRREQRRRRRWPARKSGRRRRRMPPWRRWRAAAPRGRRPEPAAGRHRLSRGPAQCFATLFNRASVVRARGAILPRQHAAGSGVKARAGHGSRRVPLAGAGPARVGPGGPGGSVAAKRTQRAAPVHRAQDSRPWSSARGAAYTAAASTPLDMPVTVSSVPSASPKPSLSAAAAAAART